MLFIANEVDAETSQGKSGRLLMNETILFSAQ